MDKGSNNSTDNKKDNTGTVQIIVSIITGVVAIVVALIGLAGVLAPLKANSTPAAPTAISISTDTTVPTFTLQPDTPIPSPFFTEVYTPTLSPTETFTPISSPTLTFTPNSGLPIGMQVKVTADPSRGRPPLTVRLDARDSYLRAPNGDIFECRNGACKYTWYLTVTGGQPEELDSKSGFIQLTFDRRGTYYINVYVCHGSDNPTCNSGGAIVIVE